MEQTSQEDWLDRQLREAAPYIDDDGFSKRVLAQLPAPRPQRRSARAIILMGLTVLGSIIAYIISDGGRVIGANVRTHFFTIHLVALAR